jgi:hypothetical protein
MLGVSACKAGALGARLELAAHIFARCFEHPILVALPIAIHRQERFGDKVADAVLDRRIGKGAESGDGARGVEREAPREQGQSTQDGAFGLR